MAERMAIHRITRGHGAARQVIMPGRVFTLTDAEAEVLDAQGSTADPREVRERGDGDTTIIERVAEPVIPEVQAAALPADPAAAAMAATAAAMAAPGAAKPVVTVKNGATTRAQPADDDEL